MAQKRMFNKSITNSSVFLKMPATSRLLYYDLGMNADDDGFVEQFMVLRMTGATQQDLGVLELNGLVKILDNNVLWIKDWKENNYIQKDRYKPSKYLSVYDLDTLCIQDVSSDKIRLDKNSIDNIYIVEKNVQKNEKNNNLDDVYEIIDYLNLTTGSNYRHNTKSTVTKIKARLNEGFNVDDFKKVINNKTQEWLGTEWENYLRPETLFGTKFEQYLNQKNFNKKEKQLTQREKDDLFLKKMKEELKDE